VDLNGIVAEACDILASDALLHGAVLSSLPAPSPCPVAAERVELVQVFLNLAGNALDAVACVAAGTRSVDIAVVAARGDSYVLAVTDTGPGIPLHVLPRVFEPLVSTKADGLGLGLEIVSSIVAAHGGRTWAGNNRDGGAHFIVELPKARVEPCAPQTTQRLC
jgi:C4-dicarboxylate-specific signal transduction histidine kinase